MADLTKEQKLSGLTGVTDIVDLLSKVNLVQYKTGWTSKHLAADAIREITRLRQLLSEAEKGLERAWIIPGPGNEYRMLTRPPAGDEAPSVAIVYRALQSEDR